MTLHEKYGELLALGEKLKVKEGDVREEGGKLRIKGITEYQFGKDLLWDKIKTYPSWETEIEADITVEKTDIYGVYEVVSGDTLSKIAKWHLGKSSRYMDIFKLNQDILKNPDLIKVGQKLKLPPKS